MVTQRGGRTQPRKSRKSVTSTTFACHKRQVLLQMPQRMTAGTRPFADNRWPTLLWKHYRKAPQCTAGPMLSVARGDRKRPFSYIGSTNTGIVISSRLSTPSQIGTIVRIGWNVTAFCCRAEVFRSLWKLDVPFRLSSALILRPGLGPAVPDGGKQLSAVGKMGPIEIKLPGLMVVT